MLLRVGEPARGTVTRSGSLDQGYPGLHSLALVLRTGARNGRLEVLLAHQGGPFWVKKDIIYP
jgi:hypothetical protein